MGGGPSGISSPRSTTRARARFRWLRPIFRCGSESSVRSWLSTAGRRRAACAIAGDRSHVGWSGTRSTRTRAPNPASAIAIASSAAHCSETVAVLGRDENNHPPWARDLYDSSTRTPGSVDPSLVAASVATIAATGGPADFDDFLERFEQAADPQTELRFLSALADFDDARAGGSSARHDLTDKVRSQNAPTSCDGRSPTGTTVAPPGLSSLNTGRRQRTLSLEQHRQARRGCSIAVQAVPGRLRLRVLRAARGPPRRQDLAQHSKGSRSTSLCGRANPRGSPNTCSRVNPPRQIAAGVA